MSKPEDSECTEPTEVDYLRAVLSRTEQLIFALDIDKRVRDVFFGSPEQLLLEPAQFLGKRLSDTPFPPAATGEIEAIVDEAIATRGVARGEYSVPLPDRTDRYALVATYTEFDQEPLLICTARDISARTRATDALVETSQQMAKLVANVPGAIYQFELGADGTMRIPYMSPNIRDLHTATAEQIIADPSLAFSRIHPDDLERVRASIYRSAERLSHWDVEYRALREDGTYGWHRGVSTPERREDGSTVWYGIFQDVSETRELIAELQETRERATALDAERSRILESITDGFFVLNSEMVVEYYNEAAEQLLGKSRLEVIGRDIFDSFPEARGSVFEQNYRYALEHETHISFEVYFKPYREWYNVSVYPYSGKISVIFQVVTDQKNVEASLRAAIDEAQTANRAKSEFLANMSHEIRTPLNGVIGFTELLETTDLSDLQRQYLHSALSSAHSLMSVISDVLDFSKIEAGKLDLEPIRTDIIHLAATSVDIVTFTADRKGIELLLDIPPDTPRFATVDPIRLKQILANLLSNAVKFTESGEIELTVRFRPVNDTEGVFTFSVRDTGIGISEEQRSRLFQAFSQGDTSTTRRFGGTGLGLIISNSLAQKMGGIITLESEPGLGSVFSFDISAPYATGEEQLRGVIPGSHRVLVVDDNATNRTILCSTLGYLGVECEVAASGREAITLVEAGRPYNLLIIDYHMSGLDGLATVEWIREKLAIDAATLPVVLLHSSSDDAHLAAQQERLGIRILLAKPVTWSSLYTYLLELLVPGGARSPAADGREASPADAEAALHPAPAGPAREPSGDRGQVRVVVAEDNSINQILMQALLARLVPQARVELADNGRAAVDLVTSTHPHLVLMDVQMPELDGVAATREIRAHTDASIRSVPIVAVTAGALESERQRCLDAGMNLFLTKPVQLEELEQVLNSLIEIDDGSTTARGESQGHHVDLARLRTRLDGDEATLRLLLDRCLHDSPLQIRELVRSVAASESKQALHVAHTLKGMARTMEFHVLAELVAELERQFNDAGSAERQSLAARVEGEWERVREILAAERDGGGPHAPVATSS